MLKFNAFTYYIIKCFIFQNKFIFSLKKSKMKILICIFLNVLTLINSQESKFDFEGLV